MNLMKAVAIVALTMGVGTGPLLAGLPSPGDCLRAPAPKPQSAAADLWYTPRGVPYVQALSADPFMRSFVGGAKKPRRPTETRPCGTK